MSLITNNRNYSGLPNPNSFPFKDISITTQDGTLLRVDPKDLQSALQYGQTKGDKDFVAWIKDLQTAVHKPPSPDFDVCIGCGSQDLMVKAFESMFIFWKNSLPLCSVSQPR